MSAKLSALAWLLILAAGILPAKSPDAKETLGLEFSKKVFDIGERYAYGAAQVHVGVSNRSDHTIRIVDIVARGVTAKIPALPIALAAGESREFDLEIPLDRLLGAVDMRFGVYTDESSDPSRDPGTAPYKLGFSGFVQSAYEPEAPAVDFGIVRVGQPAVQEFSLTSRESPALLLTDPATVDAFVKTSSVAGSDAQTRRVKLELQPGTRRGPVEGNVALTTNIASHPSLIIPYRAAIYGDLVPSESILDFGLARIGQRYSQVFRVESTSGKKFTIESVADEAGMFSMPQKPTVCGKQPGTCFDVELVLAPRQTAMFREPVKLRISGHPETELVITARAFVVAADTKVNPLPVTQQESR